MPHDDDAPRTDPSGDAPDARSRDAVDGRPAAGRAPVKVVWFSFRGLFADNPRALYEGMLARGVDAEHTWLCTADTAPTYPAGVRTVEYRTPAAVEALAEADLVVANDCMSMEWTKSPGTTYLQTWHGTPLKRIHHDAPPRPGWLDAADRDVARWDLLLSPNPPSTERLRKAFGFSGEVLETGYPRNDVLSGPDRDRLRAETRTRLGVPEGTTAVLYAPTWRDDLVLDDPGGPGFRLPLDLADLTARRGGDTVLLVRLHSIVQGRLGQLPEGVVDVTDEPDPAALYLAADVLVTDYSSVMFDFAVTGRPVLLYAYDLEHYRDGLRGFYEDVEELAPGPLLRTSREVVDTLGRLDEVTRAYGDRLRAFRETWCSLEDGHATDRVLDRLLAPGNRPAGPTAERG
ncbi:CDP-glycerol glycerophosphotransferase family protein [Geodermatophilus nigrescens]